MCVLDGLHVKDCYVSQAEHYLYALRRSQRLINKRRKLRALQGMNASVGLAANAELDSVPSHVETPQKSSISHISHANETALRSRDPSAPIPDARSDNTLIPSVPQRLHLPGDAEERGTLKADVADVSTSDVVVGDGHDGGASEQTLNNVVSRLVTSVHNKNTTHDEFESKYEEELDQQINAILNDSNQWSSDLKALSDTN